MITMHHVHLSNIDLNLLSVLSALLHHRNVTAAANEVGLSQPATSRALSRLRDLFGDPILVRAGRRMVLTPLGVDLSEKLPHVIEGITALVAPRAFDPASANDLVRINAPDATTAVVLSKVFGVISRTAPNLRYEITNAASGRFNALAAGQIDLAIDVFEDVPSGFYQQCLMRDRIVGLARLGHPILVGVAGLEQFIEWPHIRLTTASNRLLEQYLKSHGLERTIPVSVSNFLVGASIAAETDWILAIPSGLAYRAASIYPVECFELDMKLPTHPLDLVWHERMHSNPCHRWMRDQISTIISEQIAQPDGEYGADLPV